MRQLTGYAIFAVIGIVLFKFMVGILGLAFSLMWSILWLAALGFVFYLLLRLISPTAARRVRDWIRGNREAAEA